MATEMATEARQEWKQRQRPDVRSVEQEQQSRLWQQERKQWRQQLVKLHIKQNDNRRQFEQPGLRQQPSSNNNKNGNNNNSGNGNQGSNSSSKVITGSGNGNGQGSNNGGKNDNKKKTITSRLK